MADVITTLHPEGAPEDDLYPNIKKENLPSTLQPVADFALSEYEKTLNIWDEVWESGSLDQNGQESPSSTQIRSKWFIRVKPSTVYYAHCNPDETMPHINVICFYGENKNFISRLTYGVSNAPFTTPSNCFYIKFRVDDTTTYNHDITISKGNYDVGYHSFNGFVMHEIDCRGVLLWENGNPFGTFNPATISVVDMSDYRAIRFVYRVNNSTSNSTYIADIEYQVGRGATLIALNEYVVHGRKATFTSSTSITFGQGYSGTTDTEYACIPVAIYGIK